MNEEKLARKLADKFPGTTMLFWRKAINTEQELIIETLKKGGAVKLYNFGSFTKTHRKERKGTNPSTKKPMMISARNSVKFKPSAHFKRQINEKTN